MNGVEMNGITINAITVIGPAWGNGVRQTAIHHFRAAAALGKPRNINIHHLRGPSID